MSCWLRQTRRLNRDQVRHRRLLLRVALRMSIRPPRLRLSGLRTDRASWPARILRATTKPTTSTWRTTTSRLRNPWHGQRHPHGGCSAALMVHACWRPRKTILSARRRIPTHGTTGLVRSRNRRSRKGSMSPMGLLQLSLQRHSYRCTYKNPRGHLRIAPRRYNCRCTYKNPRGLLLIVPQRLGRRRVYENPRGPLQFGLSCGELAKSYQFQFTRLERVLVARSLHRSPPAACRWNSATRAPT